MERELPEMVTERGEGLVSGEVCWAAVMPITMSVTCHLNNIKVIAENLPLSSIEWPHAWS